MDLGAASGSTDTLHDSIIVVSGLPRSGTSMMMAMLEAGGIPLLVDGERMADEDNPKGYYEFERVKNLQDGEVNWLSQARGKAIKIISYLLLKVPASYYYQVIFIHRKIDEILSSQKKMLLNRGEDPNKVNDSELESILRNHLKMVEDWMRTQSNLRHIDVDYNRILKNPEADIERIATFLGIPLNLEGMRSIIDPNLYRQRH
jgi:hypothetical protein